jgi:CBS domain-containing protein
MDSKAQLESLPSIYRKKLKNLVQEGTLIVLNSEETVSSALDKLAYHNISSAPVLLKQSNESENFTGISGVLGFIDMLDILAYLVKVVTGKMKSNFDKIPPSFSTEILNFEDIDIIKKRSHEFKVQSVTELIDLSGRNSFNVLYQDMTLQDALRFYAQGIHRIAVLDNSNNVFGVVSQWTIADYLEWNNRDTSQVPSLKGSIKNFRFKTENVISVNKNERTIDAFMKMHTNQLSALAILDDSGNLISNLSASDLKGLREKDFQELLKPVGEFIANMRTQQARPINYLISVDENNNSVFDVFQIIKKEQVHRVYVVEGEQRKPKAVISLTDIMRALLPIETHATQ